MIQNDHYMHNLIERSQYSKRIILNPFGMSFRWCNNNCDFCYLKDFMFQKPLTVKEMNTITQNVVEWLDLYGKDIPKDVRITMILIGGEFYCLGDEYYDCLKRCVVRVSKVLAKYNIELDNVGLCTNLLVSKDRIDKIIELHEYCLRRSHSCDIFTSFDLWGRFHTEEKCKLWFDNILALKDIIPIGIELMLSKPGIQNYLNDTSFEPKYFDQLLELKQIHVCGECITVKELTPDINDAIAFYKKILDKHGLDCTMLQEFSLDENTEIRDDAPSMLVGFDQEGVIEKYCNALFRRTIDNDSDDNNFYCIQNYNKYMHYLDNVIGCGHCKFRKLCHLSNTSTCFICYRSYNGLIKPHNCYRKKIYEIVEKYNELHRKNN